MTENNNSPLVLVADDELPAATILKHIFEREGYQVQIAKNGVIALELAQNLQPDLILLDIQMPQMNGFEVLRRLRENPITSGIPTIVVSARAREPSDIALGLNIGADDYISKPFAPQELLARARSKMRAKQLEESLHQRTKELEVLLRISEELNQHLEIEDLFLLSLYLMLDLLPGDIAIMCQLDEQGFITTHRAQFNDDSLSEATIENLINLHQNAKIEFSWNNPNEKTELPYGMVAPLIHAENPLGLLIIASQSTPYMENHQKLFGGISRQVSLALHNAELNEIQANYALHLEDMVTKRTEELKNTQKMLFRSEKLASIGHLAASIAHEINNPLQPIQLNLEFLLEEIENNEPVDRELIEMMQESVNRISRIVRQLLEFTKSNNESKFAEVDIGNVLYSIVRLNEKAFERDKMQILAEIEDVPSIMANRDQLEQVFMNMVINAKAAMERGGKLFIRVWKNDTHVIIQFKDNGKGIPDEILNKIFDPFMSTKPNGTGLGLFVTYGIIEGHQGEIEVQSKVNMGTTFTITLPLNMKLVN